MVLSHLDVYKDYLPIDHLKLIPIGVLNPVFPIINILKIIF